MICTVGVGDGVDVAVVGVGVANGDANGDGVVNPENYLFLLTNMTVDTRRTAV
jgi:hypothetical protein